MDPLLCLSIAQESLSYNLKFFVRLPRVLTYLQARIVGRQRPVKTFPIMTFHLRLRAQSPTKNSHLFFPDTFVRDTEPNCICDNVRLHQKAK